MTLTYQLPDDLHGAQLHELPQAWFIDVRCEACERGGGWTVWWLADHYGKAVTVGSLLARTRCRCRARATSAQLREAPPRGGGGSGWTARTAPIVIPPPAPPVLSEELEQIDVDWGAPPPRRGPLR